MIASLRGTDEPDRRVLLSNHYDAWVYGAVDPSSGTATMLSIGRALGRLAAEGWRPRRTIMIAAWDAEEYTLTGSTEWGEENESDLRQQRRRLHQRRRGDARLALLALGLSPAVRGDPGGRARACPIPAKPERTVADAWREDAGFIGVQSYATAAGARDSSCRSSVLGSGSDYTVFFNRLGVAVGGPDLRRARTACTTRSTTPTAGWRRRAIPGFATTPGWRG